MHNLPKSVDHISRVYSPDLKNVVLYLLSKPGPRKTIEEVLALMGGRVLDELNSSFVWVCSLSSREGGGMLTVGVTRAGRRIRSREN